MLSFRIMTTVLCYEAWMADLLLDVLSARHRVPHAGTGEPLHVLHDNERFLLQGDDGQVVVIQLRIAEGVKARPHWVLE